MRTLALWLLLAPSLAAQEEVQVLLTEAEALKIALPGAERVLERTIALDGEILAAVQDRLKRKDVETAHRVFIGMKGGSPCGYAVVTEEIGKYLPITFMVGVDPSGRCADVAVMIHREKIGTDCSKRRYLDQIKGKSLSDPIRRNRDLLTISGATLSCDGVARGVRKALAVVQESCLSRPANLGKLLQEDAPVVQERYVMGTLCRITAYGVKPDAVSAAFDEIKRWDAILSDYRDDSELSRLNAAGELAVSADFRSFLEDCGRWVKATDGLFDPTVGPLMRLWGFRGGQPAEPSAADLDAARARVGWKHVRLDASGVKLDARAALDPGGIGKGWALDRAAAILKKAGATAAGLDFGSTFLAIGAPPGQEGWKAAIRDPFAPDKVRAWIRVRDAALSTSGTYERFVEIGGRRLGHLMDPRTGRPGEASASVSVIAPTATESDVLTKPLFLLGADGGVDFAKRLGRAAMIVPADPKKAEAATAEWSKLTVENNP